MKTLSEHIVGLTESLMRSDAHDLIHAIKDARDFQVLHIRDALLELLLQEAHWRLECDDDTKDATERALTRDAACYAAAALGE